MFSTHIKHSQTHLRYLNLRPRSGRRLPGRAGLPVLLRMFPQVPQHVSLLHKGLPAIRTGVRSLAAVRPPVRHQVPFAHEILVAEIAPV